MKLPTYEQQITQPQKEITQPVEQAFGIETAQAKQQLASGIQQATEQIGNRLIQMEENNQLLKVNQLKTKSLAADIDLKDHFTSLQGLNASDSTKLYVEKSEEYKQRILQDTPQQHKAEMALWLDQKTISGTNMISTHEVGQVRDATINQIKSRIVLQNQTAMKDPTPESVLNTVTQNNLAIDQIAKTEGWSEDEIKLYKVNTNQAMLETVTNSLTSSNNIEQAQNLVKTHAEYYLGESSPLYKTKMATLSNALVEKNAWSVASSLADKNFRKGGLPNPTGLADGEAEINNSNHTPEQKKVLLSNYGTAWTIRKKAFDDGSKIRRDSMFAEMAIAEQNMYTKGANITGIINGLNSRINSLSLMDMNQDEITSLRDKTTSMYKQFQTLQTQREHAQSAKKSAQTADQLRRDKLEVDKAKMNGIREIRFNVGKYTDVNDFALKNPKIPIDEALTIARAGGLYDPQNPNSIEVAPEVKQYLYKTYENNPDGLIQATQQFMEYRNVKINDFKLEHNNRTPSKLEMHAIDQRGIVDGALTKQGTFFNWGNEYAPEYTSKTVNGVTYIMKDGAWTEVEPDKKPAKKPPKQNTHVTPKKNYVPSNIPESYYTDESDLEPQDRTPPTIGTTIKPPTKTKEAKPVQNLNIQFPTTSKAEFMFNELNKPENKKKNKQNKKRGE